jgi:hypothetical protein
MVVRSYSSVRSFLHDRSSFTSVISGRQVLWQRGFFCALLHASIYTKVAAGRLAIAACDVSLDAV